MPKSKSYVIRLAGEQIELKPVENIATLLPMNRPSPDPSQEGSKRTSTPSQFPSGEGLGVGSWSQCAPKKAPGLSMNRNVGQASRLPRRRSQAQTCVIPLALRARGAGGTPALPWSMPHGAQAQEHSRFSQSLNSPRFLGDATPNVLARNQPCLVPGEKVLG